MALGKKAMMVFENLIQKGKIPMPREVIKIDQTSLFDEPGNDDEKYKKMVFHLHYIKLDENPNSDPMPKQSFKQFVMRDKMGNVKTFRNKEGKLDVFQGGYTDKKVTSTKDALVSQIKYILSTTYRGHPAFKKDVHVTRCEFIFNPLAAMTKKDEEEKQSWAATLGKIAVALLGAMAAGGAGSAALAPAGATEQEERIAQLESSCQAYDVRLADHGHLLSVMEPGI